MAETSRIAWTDATWNPWVGCSPVSAGCSNCYAERDRTRYGWDFRGERKRTSPAYWRGPLKWNRDAAAKGERLRVFCGSLCDVCEDRPELDTIRHDLWALVEDTPSLDWLLLTKRAHRLAAIPERIRPLRHVHLGVTAEDQRASDERVPLLLATACAGVRFVSMEPLLGPVVLPAHDGLGWIIVGGESGPHARPMDLAWSRAIRDQRARSWTAWFFKQTGSNPIGCAKPKSRAGEDPAEWPEDLRVRQTPWPW